MKQRKKSFGMRISAFVLSFAMVCTLLAGINVVAFAAEDTLSVICFYNDADKGGDGEHLFTIDQGEMDWLSSLPTWDNYGEAWKAPVSSSSAIYRCYNPNSGEHHYAAAGEAAWLVSQGWTQEKLAFYSDDNQGVPVYRLWNGLAGVGSHYYTINEFEKDILVAGGWQFEGVNFYGVKGEEPTTKALSASQEGSNKIMVSSEDGFTGEESFVVSHGDLVDELADLDYDEELDVYTITLADPIEDATYTVSCEGFKDATFEGEVSEKEMTAVQTGAAEVTVTSTTPFDSADEFIVTRGTFEETVISTEYDDDMCTVKLTLDASMKDAEYTVACSDEEYDPVTFEAEAPAVDMLVFSGENLIATSNDLYTGTVGFATLDQWGHNIKDDSLDVADFSVAGGKPAGAGARLIPGGFIYSNEEAGFDEGTGAIEIAAPAATYDGGKWTGSPFALNSEVTITAVFDDNTEVAKGQFTVVATSVVSNVMVGDVKLNPDHANYPDLEGKRITAQRFSHTLKAANDNIGAYVLPMMVFDQYGNTLNATQLNEMVKDGSLFVTPDLSKGQFSIVTAVLPANETLHLPGFVDVEEGFVALPVCGDGSSSGVGTLSILSTGGFTTTKQISVEKNEVIDELSVTVGDLQAGKPAPVLAVPTDQYGDLVDISKLTPKAGQPDPTVPGIYGNGTDTLTIVDFGGGESTIELSNGEFLVNADGVAIVNTTEGVEVITVQTATNQVDVIQKKVAPEAIPTKVKGILETETPVLGGAKQALKLNEDYTPIFVDQYGALYEGLTTTPGTGYYYDITPSTKNTGSRLDGTTIVKSGAAITATTDTYTINLKKNGETISYKSFNVKIASEAKSYTATLKSPFDLYVGAPTNATGSANQIVLIGVDASGNKFPVNIDGTVYAASLRGSGAIGQKGEIEVSSGGAITVKTGTETIINEGTKTVDIFLGNVLVTSVDVSYSDEMPETMAIVCEDKDGTIYNMDNGFTMTNAAGGYKYFNGVSGLAGKGVVYISLTNAAGIDPEDPNTYDYKVDRKSVV